MESPAAVLPDFSERLHQSRAVVRVCRPRGFCAPKELQEEIGHHASSWWMVIQGAVMRGQRATWPPSLRFRLPSQRGGCRLKINAPSTASNDSFAVNHFQK